MRKLYAQQADYWDTKVEFSKSMGELLELLELLDEHGVNKHGIEKAFDEQGTIKSMRVAFVLDQRSHSILFERLDIDWDRRTTRSETELTKQAARQMGRFAVWMMKSVLAMARMGHPELLLPYVLVADTKGSATTLQESGAALLSGGERFMVVEAPVLALPEKT